MGCLLSPNMARQKQAQSEPDNLDMIKKSQPKVNTYIYKQVNIGEQDYDARIIAESFYNLLVGKPWEVQLKEQDWEKYRERTRKPSSQIAVLGYEKTGKSYLLSKLMEQELPQGKHVRTRGLGIIYENKKGYPWIALDTPGTNISVKVETIKEELKKYFIEKNISDNEITRMLFGDNILIESLLQEFVTDHAQVILVVIGKLRRDDQRLITRIKALKGKRVIVVHNLHECQDRESVEQVIKEDIIGAFKTTPRSITNRSENEVNTKSYIEADGKGIQHIIMAHEGTPAGDYYNEIALQYIREVINTDNKTAKFNLIEAFTNYLNEHSKKYFAVTDDASPSQPIQLLKDRDDLPTGIILNEANKYELKLSSADEFGDIKTYARDGLENVPFSVKIIDHTNDDKSEQRSLQVEFEVVGDCQDEELKFGIDFSDDKVKVTIIGTSKDNTVYDKTKEEIVQNIRKFGNFKIVTDLIHIGGYTIHKAEKAQIKQNIPGLKTVRWNLHRLNNQIL